ncbi:tape measure protein [Acinetobacter sp. FDAARGOS_724]|uniref:tape measure protein n=1 Tax=Acinetobacter sp. FDAARGOS_724 TaxID=2545797 RepID=UPI00158CA660|nr:tape measure protein [Acinetobacter sp. FDAARGOS_724]QKW83384.1 tape measure protein [Acinetobacter sp. FDAARGOS_724]
MSKNLTFKLIMDADNKGFVSSVKQSESVAKSVFDAIKTESDKLKQSSAEASKELGNIIPKGTSELAADLTKSLSSATEIIKDAGENAKSTADNFTDFGNKSHKALDLLKADLTSAKQKLQEFANSNASPADIEVAQRQVDQLEKEVQQADQAFNDFQAEVGRANTQLKETDSAAASAKKGLDGAKFAVNALVSAMAALGVGLGLRELAEAADSYTNLSARIKIATAEHGNFEQAMAGVHQVALATNSNLEATAGLFTKVNDVGKQMGMTQQQSLDLVKTINMAIQTGGGSAQASEAAITQFTQALQSGVLRGDEFNSIMEQAPGISKALAASLGVTTGELRKMAETGELSTEKVIKALQGQSAAIQAEYDQFPTTIGNALTKIATQWQILIGTMDQANGASATVAEWLVVLADNMDVVNILLKDVGEGFVWVGDQLKKIDISIFESLKNALSSAYDAIKDVVITLADLGKTVADVLGTSLSTALSALSSLTGEVTEAGEQVSFLERVLQGLSIAFGFISDGAAAIKIGINLLTGAFFDLAGAANSVLAALTWGDLSKQFAANADAMKQKAKEYYAEADKDAQDFQSKGLQRLEEASKTQAEKDAESVALSKAKLEQLLADQTAEVEGKKVSEQEKLKAVQDYAEAAIKANGGVMDGTMQAELMTKGYIVTMNDAGKVSVEAWDAAAEGAERNANMADKARKAATALGLDLDVSLNRVSAKFKETEGQLDSFAGGLEGLGVEGKQAGDMTYQAWLKWLETAKSQAEIDYAKAKLQEFGTQGQISTSQVEQGLIAIKLQAQGLPDDIDPVTEAFKRLGIQTKEQLKLSAQQALMDYITIRDSGKATAEGIQKAYEKAAQSAAASGDAGRIAAVNAMNAGRNLEVQIDDTGKAVVKTMDDWTKSNDRVKDSARGIGDGYRHAGQIAREEAKSSTEAWADAVNKAKSDFNKEMKRQGEALSKGIYDYDSYTKSDVISQLKSKGYDDKEAEKLAGTIWSKAMAADRDAKAEGLGKESSVAMKALINAEFDRAAANGITTQHGTNKINELLRSINVASTGSSSFNDYAPSIPSAPSVRDTGQPAKEVTYNFDFNGKQMQFSGPAGQESLMNELVNQLKIQARST